jgi:hypothetical protein
MRFHWDLTQGCLLRTPKSSARLNTIEFKRGDTATIELVFYANSQPVLLEPGHAIRFAIKRQGEHDGEPLVFTATFTEDTDTRTYTASPSFNTAPLTALFASPNAPDRLDLMGEFSLRNGDDTHGWVSSQTLNVCVFNDVIRGNEGQPGSLIDAQQSWQWLLASLAAGAHVSLTPDHSARVLTIAAEAGASGNGWTPLFAVVNDGERRVLQLTSWVGGTGDAPQGSGYYLGDAGLVATISDAVNVRGASGAQGEPGSDGINGLDGRDGNDGMDGNSGWSPLFALVADGERRVLQLTAWTGGSGNAPQGAGQYLGAAGLVSTPTEALDLRGAQGSAGANGIDGQDGTHGWTPVLAVVSDGERRVLQLTAWTGGSGAAPEAAGFYLGASGLVANIAEALDLRGAAGVAGINGIDGVNGSDATPITSISFDGSNLTIYTSSGQSFGPFYVRGSDGSQGPAGSNGADATPITQISFDGSNLTIYTSSGQSFGPFYIRGNDGSSGVDGQPGTSGWSPLFSVIEDGDRRVLQLQSWSGGSGGTPGYEGYYLGPSGFTPYVYEATDIRGAQGSAGEAGSNGADATPITSIDFDGYNLTIHTSSGQSFGPFYVRGSDGPPGADGGSGGYNGADGANGWSPVLAVISDGERRVLQLQSWTVGSGSTPGSEGYYLGASGFTPYLYEAVDLRGASGNDGSNGADATPITNIDFDGSNLTFHTSSGQSFGPFYVRGSDGPPGADGGYGGNNGADGANGWSPQLAIVLDGERHVLQLQSWVGGSGSTPGNEGSYLGPYGYTTSISEAVDIGGALQPLAPIDNVNGTASLSGSDTVDVAQLEAQIADLQTKLQLVLDRLRSHNLISAS